MPVCQDVSPSEVVVVVVVEVEVVYASADALDALASYNACI